MPIYEFECQKCKTRFEKLLSASDDTCQVCASCGSADVKKLISSFGFASSGGKNSYGSGCSGCSSTNCSSCGT